MTKEGERECGSIRSNPLALFQDRW